MADEFHPATTTAVSKRLYQDLKDESESLGKLTVLGGWAVYEHVHPARAQESQDVDVLIHDQATWDEVVPFFVRRGFRWRPLGRVRDQRLVHPDHAHVAVDVFYGRDVDNDVLRRHFGTRWTANRKDLPYEGFVPSLPVVLRDKIETLPKRAGAEADLKRLKDVLDVHSLLFHNRAGRAPGDLLADVDLAPQAARRAVETVEQVSAARDGYRQEIEEVLEALRGLV